MHAGNFDPPFRLLGFIRLVPPPAVGFSVVFDLGFIRSGGRGLESFPRFSTLLL